MEPILITPILIAFTIQFLILLLIRSGISQISFSNFLMLLQKSLTLFFLWIMFPRPLYDLILLQVSSHLRILMNSLDRIIPLQHRENLFGKILYLLRDLSYFFVSSMINSRLEICCKIRI